MMRRGGAKAYADAIDGGDEYDEDDDYDDSEDVNFDEDEPYLNTSVSHQKGTLIGLFTVLCLYLCVCVSMIL